MNKSDTDEDNSDSDKDKEDTNIMIQGKEKKRKLDEEESTRRDWRKVPEVKLINITSYFLRLTDKQSGDVDSRKEEERKKELPEEVEAETTKSERDKDRADIGLGADRIRSRIREVKFEVMRPRYFGPVIDSKEKEEDPNCVR